MAIEKGVNSFATVEEADAYFEDRLDVAAWDDAAEELKAKALVTATSVLNQLDWSGIAVSETQALAFPRKELSYLDSKLGYYTVMASDSVPNMVVRATLELAYHLLNNDGLLDSSGSVRSIVVGPIQLEMISSPSVIPKTVSKLVRPLLQNRGAHSWWRAN